ncbi:hypothetical protein Ancab_012505 [Ancistrocladus abbreviatus]
MNTEKVHPTTTKPTTPTSTTTATASTRTSTPTTTNRPKFPPSKSQQYSATRPIFRPQSTTPSKPRSSPRRQHRSCCCKCILCSALVLLILLVLAGVTAAIFYAVYHPQSPTFIVSSLIISHFNLTSTDLTSNFNLTVSTRNKNQKITFYYNPIRVSIFSGGIDIGDGVFPSFVHKAKNSTTLSAVISSDGGSTIAGGDLATLKSEIDNNNGLELKIEMETKAKFNIGKVKTRKFGIRVSCNGIKAAASNGKLTGSVNTTGAKCKGKWKIKIWSRNLFI